MVTFGGLPSPFAGFSSFNYLLIGKEKELKL